MYDPPPTANRTHLSAGKGYPAPTTSLFQHQTCHQCKWDDSKPPGAQIINQIQASNRILGTLPKIRGIRHRQLPEAPGRQSNTEDREGDASQRKPASPTGVERIGLDRAAILSTGKLILDLLHIKASRFSGPQAGTNAGGERMPKQFPWLKRPSRGGHFRRAAPRWASPTQSTLHKAKQQSWRSRRPVM